MTLPANRINFNGTIDEFVNNLKKRVSEKFDAIICFDNDEGTGKSAANIQVAKRVDASFTIGKDRLFNYPNPESITKAVNELPLGSYIDIDEAGNVFYKQDWNTRESRELNKLFMRSRKKGKIIGMCIPRFIDLTEYFRNHRVYYRVHIPYRGVAVVYVKDTKKDIVDRWHLLENREYMNKAMSDKYKQDLEPEEYLNVLRAQKGYATDFSFEPLTSEEERAYNKVVEENEREAQEIKDKTQTSATAWEESYFEPEILADECIKNGWDTIPKIQFHFKLPESKAQVVKVCVKEKQAKQQAGGQKTTINTNK